MEFFRKLGSTVGQRWKAANYNEEAFPGIATQALMELPPAHHVSLWDVVKWAMTSDQLPRQNDLEAKFGDPPLTVYTGRKFHIEVLFWTQGTPAIHQHGFSGAFHVMEGSSIHCLWEFHPTSQIETRLVLGRTAFRDAEILFKGDTRAILAGNAMYHSTYHLDHPSVSVVVRTGFEANKQPQYNLLPPTIAYDPKNDIATVTRQTQLLQMLLATNKRADFNQLARHVCATADAYTAFVLLRSTFQLIEDEVERQQLLLTAAVRHRHLIDALAPAFDRNTVGARILRLREATRNAEIRFMLALLRNVPDRASVLRLFEQRLPARDAVTGIVSAIRQLSEPALLQTRLDDLTLVLLRHLLLDHSAAEILADLDRTNDPPTVNELSRLCVGLQRSWLLSSLQLGNPFAPGIVTLATQPSTHAIDAVCPEKSGPRSGNGGARTAAGGYRCVLDLQPDPLIPASLRQRHRPRADTWVVNPLLRFRDDGRYLANDVAYTEGVTSREPTAWVSDPVTSVVSSFVLGPTLAPIVSTLRPGNPLDAPLPSHIIDLLADAGLIYDPDSNEIELHKWRSSLRDARTQFESGYVALKALLHPFTLAAARAHFRKFVWEGHPDYGDRQVPRRWAAHNEPVARFILHQLSPIMEAVAGIPVKPSYVYFASYHNGAHLERHTDREQCEYSMSMLIDYSPEPEAESPWPLWLDTTRGPVAIHQGLGDVLLYRGRQLPHYRAPLPDGHTSTHIFLHYVAQDFAGPLD